MLERAEDRATLSLRDIPLDGVPVHIQDIIKNHKAFSESNAFGREGVGSPEEYEKLIISKENRISIFEYFNKGIHYMTVGTEEDRPVFQVFAHFMRQAERNV
jgi:hypothetical protein